VPMCMKSVQCFHFRPGRGTNMSRRLLTAEVHLNPRILHAGFVLDKSTIKIGSCPSNWLSRQHHFTNALNALIHLYSVYRQHYN
jgi:hypothetical protein